MVGAMRAAGAGAAVLALSSAAAAQADASLRAFVAANRCPVVERLALIHARGDRSSSRGRFLIVAPRDNGHAYVQCIFFDHDTKLHCEASSGFYRYRPDSGLRLRLDPDKVAALARLGFSTDDSAGNFKREIDLGDPPDLVAAAELMLTALHDGYDARLGAELALKAPLAPGKLKRFSRCVPVS